MKKSFVPPKNHRTREPIRDLIDFSKNIHRNRKTIRDFVDSRGRKNHSIFKGFDKSHKDLEISSFKILKKSKTHFSQKVSGNWSHTFSLLFVPKIFFRFPWGTTFYSFVCYTLRAFNHFINEYFNYRFIRTHRHHS